MVLGVCVESMSLKTTYIDLAEFSEDEVRRFLNSLTTEMDTWGEVAVDSRDKSRFLRYTVDGYAATVDNEIVGIGYIYRIASLCEEKSLPIANVSVVVKKEFQGRGIGQMLHEMLEGLARKQKISRFYASQDLGNNIALYLVTKRRWTVRRVGNKNIVEKNLT